MTITKINENTLVVEVLTQELNSLDKEDLLYYILSKAIAQENIIPDKNTFLLEAVPCAKGMVFLLTVIGGRKHYRIKRENCVRIYSFSSLDDFINCNVALYRSGLKLPKSSTYIMHNIYYLCFYGRLSTGAKIIAQEFGSLHTKSNCFLAYIKEHGNLLTKGESVKLIGESF
jgi:hypothetical protein